MNDTFTMGQGLGHQLEMAFARNDWTPQLVQQATGGVFLCEVKAVLEGRARIVLIEQPPAPQAAAAPTPRTAAPPSLIPLYLSIPLVAHKARPMSELFLNRDKVIFYYRDGDLDGWFTANSPQCPAGTASLVKTPRAMTFRQMAQSATGLQSESLADLSRAIVTKGLDIVPTQWDDAIGATQNGTDLLLVNGYASFAFTKTDKKLKDENQQEYDEVVVLYAFRDDDGQWRAGVYGLGGDHEWIADRGLLLRNSP